MRGRQRSNCCVVLKNEFRLSLLEEFQKREALDADCCTDGGNFGFLATDLSEFVGDDDRLIGSGIGDQLGVGYIEKTGPVFWIGIGSPHVFYNDADLSIATLV